MARLNFQPPVIAHRGASAYAPENTLAAFTKAAQLGIKWIEFDVVQAACGEPVIFHDETLERTTNGQGEVSAYSYTYLRTLDAGAWFNPIYSNERIPSLQQTLEFLCDTKMCANIEIKALPGQEMKLVQRVLEKIKYFGHALDATLLFSSFSLAALQRTRECAPECMLGLLLHEWVADWQIYCTILRCVSVHVNVDILTPEAARLIKDMDRALLCYTVNDPERAKQLFSWGVDAVFSDVPEKIIK
jgi:glycerophosphoryl diester phosphodiesterase